MVVEMVDEKRGEHRSDDEKERSGNGSGDDGADESKAAKLKHFDQNR